MSLVDPQTLQNYLFNLLSSDNEIRNNTENELIQINNLSTKILSIPNLSTFLNSNNSVHILVLCLLCSTYWYSLDTEKNTLIPLIIHNLTNCENSSTIITNLNLELLGKMEFIPHHMQVYLFDKLNNLLKLGNKKVYGSILFKISRFLNYNDNLFFECIKIIESFDVDNDIVLINGVLQYLVKVSSKRMEIIKMSKSQIEKICINLVNILYYNLHNRSTIELIFYLLNNLQKDDYDSKYRIRIYSLFNQSIHLNIEDNEDYQLLYNLTETALSDIRYIDTKLNQEYALLIFKLLEYSYTLTTEDFMNFSYDPIEFIDSKFKISLESRIFNETRKIDISDKLLASIIKNINDISIPLTIIYRVMNDNSKIFVILKLVGAIVAIIDAETKQELFNKIINIALGTHDPVIKCLIYEFFWEFDYDVSKFSLSKNTNQPIPLLLTTLKVIVSNVEVVDITEFNHITNLLFKLNNEINETYNTIYINLIGQLFKRYPTFISNINEEWISQIVSSLVTTSSFWCDDDDIEILQILTNIVNLQTNPNHIIQLNTKYFSKAINHTIGGNESFVDDAALSLATVINFKAEKVLNLDIIRMSGSSLDFCTTSLLYANDEQRKIIKGLVYECFDDYFDYYEFLQALILTSNDQEIDDELIQLDGELEDRYKVIVSGLFKNRRFQTNVLDDIQEFTDTTQTIHRFDLKVGILGLLQLFRNTKNQECIELIHKLCQIEVKIDCGDSFFQQFWDFKKDKCLKTLKKLEEFNSFLTTI